MKNLFSILLFVLLYSGCFSSYLYTEYSDSVYKEPEYTKLPMKPNKSGVQVIFPGEKILKPYIQVDIIESSGEAFTSTETLIKNLKAQGMFHGVDAMILIDNNTFSHDEGGQITGAKSVTALGIKYIENIDYLDDCIKQVKIAVFDKESNEYNTTAEIRTNWKGDLLEFKNGDPYFSKFLYNFSDQHLVYEMKNWSFNQKEGKEGKSYLKRVLKGKKGTVKTVSAQLNQKRITSLEVKDNLNGRYSAKIEYHYNNEGTLIKKEIDSDIMGKFTIEFTYMENGNPLKYDVYKLSNGKEELYFKAMFEMYEQKELEVLLVDENVIGR